MQPHSSYPKSIFINFVYKLGKSGILVTKIGIIFYNFCFSLKFFVPLHPNFEQLNSLKGV